MYVLAFYLAMALVVVSCSQSNSISNSISKEPTPTESSKKSGGDSTAKDVALIKEVRDWFFDSRPRVVTSTDEIAGWLDEHNKDRGFSSGLYKELEKCESECEGSGAEKWRAWHRGAAWNRLSFL